MLFWILGTTFLISLMALIGIFTVALNEAFLKKILLTLVGLSAGAMLGGAFFHLIPEAIEGRDSDQVFMLILLGFLLFFIIERVLHWRHCHKGDCPVHTFGYMNIIGDCVHNFIDGLIITAAFTSDWRLGMVTFLAVALHEIPQEIGDFGVLLHAGFSKKKALALNFLAAAMVMLGGVIGYFLLDNVESTKNFLLPFAAGGFIYVATTDLMPEIGKETKLSRSIPAFIVFFIGLAIMYLLKFSGV